MSRYQLEATTSTVDEARKPVIQWAKSVIAAGERDAVEAVAGLYGYRERDPQKSWDQYNWRDQWRVDDVMFRIDEAPRLVRFVEMTEADVDRWFAERGAPRPERCEHCDANSHRSYQCSRVQREVRR